MPSQKSEFERDCQDADQALLSLSEAHLFKDKPDLLENIADRIEQARISAHNNGLPQARKLLILAFAQMHQAIGTQGIWWSFRKIHAGFIWLYFVLLLSSIVGIGVFVDFLSFGEDAPTAWNMPIAAIAYGMIGGLIRGMYWLYQKIPEIKYRATFIVPYVGGPWLASALGLFSYALLRSGTGLFGEVTSGKLESAAFAAVAMMAGFSWEWFMKQLKKLNL